MIDDALDVTDRRGVWVLGNSEGHGMISIIMILFNELLYI